MVLIYNVIALKIIPMVLYVTSVTNMLRPLPTYILMCTVACQSCDTIP